MVQWPCILKLEGDSELIFLASEQALSRELDCLIFSSSDCLIDGLGHTYQVKSCRFGYTLESQDRMLSLESVTEFIQEHQFAQAEVCLTKIQFTSIAEAINSIVVL
ncbi:DUF4144 domain-containing protein [Vibrio hepatarius]|uniref:DUF4144 domain-containing protein n=1 Tax=Vibrio hepatarius TaxID=171383 RepID=UPI001C08D339|nr:DUF4144 domain-containing protein [Vibrio hepatarius]MBU2896738.1 DUF4144 domain-containing protein [Vibrio hepatarius]